MDYKSSLFSDFVTIVLYFHRHYTKPQEDEGFLKDIPCIFKDL